MDPITTANHTDLHVSMTEPVLEAQNVTLSFGDKTVLDGIDFSLERGTVTVLIGPNGAGKSSLLSVLTADVKATSGEVLFEGKPLSSYKLAELSKKRSVMLQDHKVFFPFTVEQVVEMGRLPWQDESTEIEDAEIVAETLKTADIFDIKNQSINTVSGGEKARTSFARILAQSTEVILLDEPVASLDLKHQEQLMQVVKEFARNGGSALVVVHDLNLAAHYADTIALLDNGQVKAVGNARSVLTAQNIYESYGQSVDILEHPNSEDFLIIPRR